MATATATATVVREIKTNFAKYNTIPRYFAKENAILQYERYLAK
jgi:hypothetical protein